MEITVQSMTTNQFAGGLSNVIELVHWSATDGTSTINGTTRLKPPNGNFMSFTSLTESQVIGWVISKDSIRIKKMLADTTAKSLVSAISTPWSVGFSYEEPEAVRVARQTYQYKEAVSRLAQYVLADGRQEVVESQPTGEKVWDEATLEMVDVMADVITVTAVEPLEATVTRAVYPEDDPTAEPTEETIQNPLITADVSERSAAQAVVASTPEEIKQ